MLSSQENLDKMIDFSAIFTVKINNWEPTDTSCKSVECLTLVGLKTTEFDALHLPQIVVHTGKW